LDFWQLCRAGKQVEKWIAKAALDSYVCQNNNTIRSKNQCQAGRTRDKKEKKLIKN
jgi:hypothetical protein